jgi:hypothetical protein
VPPLVPPEVPPLVLPDVPPLVLPDVPELDAPELDAPELDVPEEPRFNASEEPLPLPEFAGPDGPDGPDGAAGPDGPAASGPISRTEQSTSPQDSGGAAGAGIVVPAPARMATVIVAEQPRRAAFFI